MNAKTLWTTLVGAGALALTGYIGATCPEWDWGKVGMAVVGAVWGAWNLHREKPKA